MNHTSVTKKKGRTSRRPQDVTLLDGRVLQLRQVERRMDGLFEQVVDGLDEQELACAVNRFNVLVSRFPNLRLSNLDRHLQAHALFSCLGSGGEPLSGFQGRWSSSVRRVSHDRQFGDSVLDCTRLPRALRKPVLSCCPLWLWRRFRWMPRSRRKTPFSRWWCVLWRLKRVWHRVEGVMVPSPWM